MTAKFLDSIVVFPPHDFGGGLVQVEADKTVLGGKGAGLVEMTKLGLPVPPGVIIPTAICKQVIEHNDTELLDQLTKRVAYLVEDVVAGKVGFVPMVSVRSGARVSMPGMMDTILNVGISQQNLEFWTKKIGQRAALDSYRRLIQMYGQTAMDIEPKRFQSALKEVMASKYGQKFLPKHESELSIPHLVKLVEKYEAVYKSQTGEAFPQTLEEQLAGAISAVFNSWNSERAIEYRKIHKIPNDWYTACVVQTMVLGNMDDKSCSGVLFSRNPSTGQNVVMGEFLPNAQGEEVVSGSATPMKLDQMNDWNPVVYTELMQLTVKLEQHYKDMVDIEFTVQSGVLYMLQVRSGKRSAMAAFAIAYGMAAVDGLITKKEALKRVTGEQYITISKPVIDPTYTVEPIATGIAGSKGIATGRVWLSSVKAKANPGGILVAKETTPDDFPGMAVSVGIFTKDGGATSHAAVVARGMDKACVVGCTQLIINDKGFTVNGHVVVEGDEITIDGSTGRAWLGVVPMIGGKVPPFVNEMIEWGVDQGVALKLDPTKDELPEEGDVFLDCTKMTKPIEVASLVAYLNADRPKLRGILSFADETGFDDSKLLTFLCLPQQSAITLDGAMELGKSFDMATSIHGRWTVVGVEALFAKNANPPFVVHRQMKTLKELMDCNGFYEVHADLKKLLKEQGTSVEKFAAMLQQAGKTLKPITKPVSREQMAFSVFGK